MDKILTGVRQFRETIYPEKQDFFRRLAGKQQSPLALFITCSDSRILPNVITDTEPGDLFIIRNAGNIVPPAGAPVGGEAATIEYAVAVLNIPNIIVCGHSQCGAMKALMTRQSTNDLPAVGQWISLAETTRRIVQRKYPNLSAAELEVAAVQENVLVQLNHIRTHPVVAERLAIGTLQLHGWYYDIGSGVISAYDEITKEFMEIDAAVIV
jgi:carbonic anhydrase